MHCSRLKAAWKISLRGNFGNPYRNRIQTVHITVKEPRKDRGNKGSEHDIASTTRSGETPQCLLPHCLSTWAVIQMKVSDHSSIILECFAYLCHSEWPSEKSGKGTQGRYIQTQKHTVHGKPLIHLLSGHFLTQLNLNILIWNESYMWLHTSQLPGGWSKVQCHHWLYGKILFWYKVKITREAVQRW